MVRTDSRREMDHSVVGARSCHFGSRLDRSEFEMSLDRLRSCHIPGEVALALEIGLQSFVVLEKVLLEMAIEWGENCAVHEWMHRPVIEDLTSLLD